MRRWVVALIIRRCQALSRGPEFVRQQGVPTVFEEWSLVKGGDALGEAARRCVGVDGVEDGMLVLNALSYAECEAVIASAESKVASFDAGKNRHGALQVWVGESWASEMARRLEPFVADDDGSFEINRRLRIYRYAPDGSEEFARHVDAAFDKSVLSQRGEIVSDDAKRSRLSVLLYLNADFEGGETAFYAPEVEGGDLLTAVKPVPGAALLFPQASDEEMDFARARWSQHAGVPVTAGRCKYVVRTDAVFDAMPSNDVAVARAVLGETCSPDSGRHLYSPYMGVEAVAPLLYALVRFLKPRRVAEVGAGFTTLGILRALRDNDRELARLARLPPDARALLDWPWTVDLETARDQPATLHCIDDCTHTAASATRVEEAARDLRLQEYLAPLDRRDAFDAVFRSESVDLFWLDFGASDRLPDYLTTVVIPALRPGGFVAIHSTLTNRATRAWLETLRDGDWPPARNLHHVSLLEPHKRFQNSITILQKRRANDGARFSEPLYSIKP
ncbi:hypothetical protein CTAYLR_003658 [Chrysophaeum taylorii]|uniref:Fe2OG dioxygenase domain-containing protein n=1 Tax=Chrysophaeum taylorii TaxID=2483200 RepID=A0AAD7XNE8_9STRA|nr:hypothetical protein CTAYLR_003658 [Chrysophaeum taylorii]